MIDKASTLNRLAESIDRHEAAIVRLFLRGSPANVAEFIISIVVNAVKNMFRTWTATDMVKEGGIIVQKKFNSTASPVFVSFGLWIRASSACVGPRIVFWCFIVSMFNRKFLIVADFIMETTAGFAISLFKVVANNDTFFPAITTAKE